MKANVYYGPHERKWEEKPRPVLKEPTDALVRIYKTTICGTDLHILKGSVATIQPGTTLGHEGIGFVEEVGAQVSRFKAGDKVLISCITSCGSCEACQKKFFGHCKTGGWQLGNTIDGCQAEWVRIPHADFSLHSVPPDLDEDGMVMLSDIVSTGLEVGVMEGKVTEDSTVAVVGVGPVGLAAMMSARVYRPREMIAVDIDEHRLSVAKELGATHVIHNKDGQAVERILALTKGRGVDTAIEAIGTPAGWDICENIVAAGGNIAILGVHGKPVTLHLERMWYRNFTLTAGLVHTHTIPLLMDAMRKKELKPGALISHRLPLSEMDKAYEMFSNASKFKALKILMVNNYL